MPQGLEVELHAELEKDEAERDVREDFCMQEHVRVEKPQHAGAEQESGSDEARDPGQETRSLGEFAADYADQQYGAEKQEIVDGKRPVGKEAECHAHLHGRCDFRTKDCGLASLKF